MALDRPRTPDCPPRVDYYSPSRLERLAMEMEVPSDELRWYLQTLVQERRRQVGDAWKKLDETLEERERRNGNGR